MGKYVYKVRHLEEESRCRTFASEKTVTCLHSQTFHGRNNLGIFLLVQTTCAGEWIVEKSHGWWPDEKKDVFWEESALLGTQPSSGCVLFVRIFIPDQDLRG